MDWVIVGLAALLALIGLVGLISSRSERRSVAGPLSSLCLAAATLIVAGPGRHTSGPWLTAFLVLVGVFLVLRRRERGTDEERLTQPDRWYYRIVARRTELGRRQSSE